MPKPLPDHSIFIYCDDPSHPAKRVAVTNFDYYAPSADRPWQPVWHERPASRAGKSAGTGMMLKESTVLEPGWANDPSIGAGEGRVRFPLICRKCKKGPVATEETLHAELNNWRSLGVSEVSLYQFAASMGRTKRG